MAQKETQNSIYMFSSNPRAVLNRIKYREPVVEQNKRHVRYGNIMYDRRVVRGNTYAQYILSTTPQPDPSEQRRQQEAKRRAIERKRAKEQLRLRTPEPVEGRKHTDVQTELYLLELIDKIEESSVECQTDAFLDRPATPLFIPAKTGKDVATQIEEGELFDFDMEVRPILEVLVGKTVEQALLEVMEEEELARLRAQQRAFEELRSAEVVEVQRLEEQERRRREEKERRIKQQKEALQKEKEAAEKVAARTFAKGYLSDLLPRVYSMLREKGYFYDPVERDVETGFLPWVMAAVNNSLGKRCVARTVLNTLIMDITERRLEAFGQQDKK
ncbi:hypothetical protein GN956_G15882 [Arapaima gigas]